MPRTLARLLFVPTLLWNLLLGRVLRVRNWWDRVDEHVILGALPFAADVPRLAAVGVRAVVNTCEEYVGPVAEYAVAGIEQLRVPTTDFQPPQLPREAVRKIIRNQHFLQPLFPQDRLDYQREPGFFLPEPA